MIYVGIDVAKAKHACCILDAKGNVLRGTFVFANNLEGLSQLKAAILAAAESQDDQQVKAGLEATGHYSENLLDFLRLSGYDPVIFNPLQVKRFRQSLSLRKTKTDQIDAKCIAQLLMSDTSSPARPSYQNQELKSLTRHRSRLVAQRSKAKVQYGRLIDLLFPELSSVCWSISQVSMLALLKALPGARKIALCRVDRLTTILIQHSAGKYRREKALQIKELARQSIGRQSEALSFELQQVIDQIEFFNRQIKALDQQLKQMVTDLNTPLTTIPGIGYRLAAIILAEIDDIARFASPDQLLAYAGLDPSTYESGSFNADRTPMSKRGSTYLRWALMQAARLAARRCPELNLYMEKKLAQGKHYFVALGHVTKKLVRLIFCLLKKNEPYVPQIA